MKKVIVIQSGFTLVEIMVVVVIIGILATVLLTNIGESVGEASAKLTKTQIRIVMDKIQMFKLRENKYPESLKDLVRKPSYAQSWPKGGYLAEDQIKDGWKKDLIYKYPSNYTDEICDIISYGEDGREGGDGVNEDIWNHDKWKNK